MPNTILTPEIIAKEALLQLENNLVMADLVHRDYSPEFAKVGDTITIRKPAKFNAKNFLGKIEKQDITEGSVPVKLDRLRDVSVDVTSKELTLDIQDFSVQVIQPAMKAIAQSIDEDLISYGVEKAGSKVSATTKPTNLEDIAKIAKSLDLKKAPMTERRLVLHPTHKYNYALTDNLSKVSYAGDNATLRDALLGKVYSLDTYMDQNAPDTNAPTAGSATSYKVTGTKGQKTVALSELNSASATVKIGDGFIYHGYFYRFTADGTGSSSSISSIAIDQPLVEDITTNNVVKVVNKPMSLAFQRNGLALVTRQLELPLGASKAAIVSANGFSVRVVYGYDQETKTDTISFDVLYGIKDLDSSLLVSLE